MNNSIKLAYNWSVSDYIDLVENTSNPVLKKYEQEELDYLKTQIENSQEKTFIDVGGGYGRALPVLAKIARNVISVEINDSMFGELEKRTRQYPNAVAIKGDANNLSALVGKGGVVNPVLICLQNSIGTWEGDYREAVAEMGQFARDNHGEVVISAWRAEMFKDFATKVYGPIEFVGKPDLSKTDFENGIYVSKKGYTTHWWSPKKREEIRKLLGGRTVRETLGTPYFILHVSYS